MLLGTSQWNKLEFMLVGQELHDPVVEDEMNLCC